MAFAVGALDEAIREYLLYRGFTQSLKFFEVERKDDKDKGFSFRVSVVHAGREGAGQLMCINSSIYALCILWAYTGESYRGVHHAVCVKVGFCQPAEFLGVPVSTVL